MTGRCVLVCAALLAALTFLLLFASGGNVKAVTYKIQYHSTLGCAGPDGSYPSADDSCTEDPDYGAYGAGLTADLQTHFAVPAADPKYSQFSYLATQGTPSTWTLATDKQIPNGAYIGTLDAISTLALLGGYCTTTLTVHFDMFECSTDNSPGNLINWDAGLSGANLTYGHEGDIPDGCRKYPKHVNDIVGGVKPRARYYGFTTVLAGMPPTQVQFVMFSPEELAGWAGATLPEKDFGDDLAYINYVILDNPLVPAAGTSSLDELCTPLNTDTNLYGKTGGDGELTQEVPPVPTAVGSFWLPTEICGDDTDNDGDTSIDEMCGIVRVTNPAAGSGILGTGSQLAGAYSESYRDADGDTIPNNQDECPFVYDTEDEAANPGDTDGDHIANACEPTPDNDHDGDQDNDGWRNQADNCPLVFQTSQANDTDGDKIGNECDTTPPGNGPNTPDGHYLNDVVIGSMCIGEDDTDEDGWCDSTEDIVGHGGEVISDSGDGDSTPEWIVLDAVMRAADNPPGWAAGTCDNRLYYHGDRLGGAEIDDDADDILPGDRTNMLDPNCEGMNLDLTSAPSSMDPLQLAKASVVGSAWHELWPTYSNTYTATSFADDDGNTVLSQGDQIDLDDGHDYHVYEVTITLWLSLKPAQTYTMAAEWYASADNMDDAYHNPVTTQWHEIYPTWSNEYEIEGWDDSGSGNTGRLGVSDQITIRDKETDEVTEWHIDEVTIDIIVIQKPDGDTDADGLVDASDNCSAKWNPTQIDRDFDGKGDACDPDDDADKINDNLEWPAGTDPKNVCDPRDFDLTNDNIIDILDVLTFKDPLAYPNRACYPPADYTICEATYRSNQ